MLAFLRRTLLAGLLAANLAACSPVPVAVSDSAPTPALAFRLIVVTGQAAIAGRVLVPTLAAGANAPGAPVEQPLAGARVDVVDLKGVAIADTSGATSDASGHFQVNGLHLGVPAFLRASYQLADGKPRTLYAFIRPAAEATCADLSLASTLVASQLNTQDGTAALYDPDKLAAIARRVAVKLPALMAIGSALVTAASGTVTTSVALPGWSELLEAATTAGVPGGQASKGAAAPVLAGLFQADAEIKQALAEAVDSSLDVGFTLQDVGENSASFQHEAPRRLVAGTVEFSCRAAAADAAGVTYYLNDRKLAAATYDGQAWITRQDSRAWADGPYLLSAFIASHDAAKPPVAVRAYLYVRNARVDASLCPGAPAGP